MLYLLLLYFIDYSFRSFLYLNLSRPIDFTIKYFVYVKIIYIVKGFFFF